MIEVFANGLKFEYWTNASVSRSLGNLCASFNLGFVASDGNGNRVKLWPGDEVEIKLDGVSVLKGYVSKVSPSFGGGSAGVSVSGYESTCDVVDCCIKSPVEWAEKNFERIMNDICNPFGLKFYNPNGVDLGKPFEKFSVDPGSKAVDAVSRLCKERGILPCSNGLGKVYVLRPSSCERGPELEEGKNIFGGSADFNLQGRFSEYTVYGTGKASKKVETCKTDSEVKRFRPLVIVDVNATEKDSVTARADWECETRKAKSLGFRVSVHGWSFADGKLWQPGLLCSFVSPSLYVDEPIDLLVSQVEYTMSGGEFVNLTLVPPESFTPQPETKKVVAKKAAKKDPWATIKKAVKG